MSNELVGHLPIDISKGLETTDSLELYLNELRKTPLLSQQEEEKLFENLHKSDDIEAANIEERGGGGAACFGDLDDDELIFLNGPLLLPD